MIASMRVNLIYFIVLLSLAVQSYRVVKVPRTPSIKFSQHPRSYSSILMADRFSDEVDIYPPVIPFDAYTGPLTSAEQDMINEGIHFFNMDTNFLQKDNLTSHVIQEGLRAGFLVDSDIEDNTGIVSKLVACLSPSPLDSPTSTRIKTAMSSVGLLTMIISVVFTVSYYLFPGSFAPQAVIEQMVNFKKWITTDSFQSFFEPPEYSESGGVYFFDDDAPMPKTTVFVR